MCATWYLSLTIFTLNIKVEINVSDTVLHTLAGIGIHSVNFIMYQNPHCYLILSHGMPHVIRSIQTLARGIVQWESTCIESAPPGVSSSAPPPPQ